MSTTTLFVYGTLRPDFPNPLARRLKTQAKFVGLGSVPGALYDCGWYPGAVFEPASRTRVIGEVFTIRHADRLLAHLDHYEGTAEPSNPFRRVEVRVRLDRGGILTAWSYEMTSFPVRSRLIESGDFLRHLKTTTPRPVRY